MQPFAGQVVVIFVKSKRLPPGSGRWRALYQHYFGGHFLTNDGGVGGSFAPHKLRLKTVAVAQGNGDALVTSNDVVISQDVTFLVQDQTGAHSLTGTG